MPEGTVFFADEPILRITAPLREAQHRPGERAAR
jgi:nicotinate phosphoribosyltransferase